MDTERPITRVLVVEDHLVARLGTVTLINAQSDMAVCGEAESGTVALSSHRHLNPDVTLVDMRLPDFDGDEVIARIRAVSPRAACVCLSTFDGDAEITRALRAGAVGYLPKHAGGAELLDAIRVASTGGRYLAAGLAARVAEYSLREHMTARELDVLRLVAKGLANKEIAFALSISEETVKSHVRNILSKLGVSDRTAAVVTAVDLGLIRIPRAGSRN